MTLKNTENNAIISITNASTGMDTVTHKGGFYNKDGHFYITYTEGEESGMGKSRVVIKADNGSVTMRRMGEYSTVMHYVLSTETELLYKTPYGNMPMKIKTHKIICRLSEEGGELSFAYGLSAGGETTENELILRVKQAED